ncbi:MAG: hypothetical protein ACTHM1_08780 [Solirubrobacteraceae bacterium]
MSRSASQVDITTTRFYASVKRMRRRHRTAAGAVGLVLAACLAFGQAAYACEAEKLYFDGMITSIISTNGAQANIDRYNPRACITSSAWSMIDNQNNGNELAQVGWLKNTAWSSSTVYYFYEYGESGTLYLPVAVGVVPNPTEYGVADKFTVYTSSGNTALFIINGSGVANAGLNWTANNAQWFSETHSNSDQTAGDTAHGVEYYGTQHLYNGSWYNDIAVNNAYDNAPNGGATWPSGAYMWTWDRRYSTEY